FLGPDSVLLALDVEFRSDLAAADLFQAVERIERDIRMRYPRIKRIYIEARALSEAARAAVTARTRESDTVPAPLAAVPTDASAASPAQSSVEPVAGRVARVR